jgi:ubiquinone/menaquinone biosynthesis C-methylase UbiE
MANEEQAKFWTEIGGPIWLEREQFLDDSARPFSNETIDVANPKAGERVLDVGCGTGPTTVELARRVAPGGEAVGLDISPLLLGRARERATEAGMDNVTFIEGDAQTFELEAGAFDVLFSRFGVMFFEDPEAAFSNLHRAIRPGGRVAFSCWQDVFQNLWLSLPTMAASSVLGPFDLPPEGAPGPFSLADADRVRAILGAAGFSDVGVREFRTTMNNPVESAGERLTFLVGMSPLGDKFKEADAETKERTVSAVLEAVEPHREDGEYKLPAAAWIVTASA